MQKITINEIILSPPIGETIDIISIISKCTSALSKLFTLDSDIDILFHDDNRVGIWCEGINDNADVWQEKDFQSDDDCCYGETEVDWLENDGFIDEYNIKTALQEEFPGWDVDCNDVICQTPDEVYEEA